MVSLDKQTPALNATGARRPDRRSRTDLDWVKRLQRHRRSLVVVVERRSGRAEHGDAGTVARGSLRVRDVGVVDGDRRSAIEGGRANMRFVGCREHGVKVAVLDK